MVQAARRRICVRGGQAGAAAVQPGEQRIVQLPAQALALPGRQHRQLGKLEEIAQVAGVQIWRQVGSDQAVEPGTAAARKTVAKPDHRLISGGKGRGAAKTILPGVVRQPPNKIQKIWQRFVIGRLRKSRLINIHKLVGQQTGLLPGEELDFHHKHDYTPGVRYNYAILNAHGNEMNFNATRPGRPAPARKALLAFLLVIVLAGCNLPGKTTPTLDPTATGQAIRDLPTPVVILQTSTPTPADTPTLPATLAPTSIPSATQYPPVTVESLTLTSRFMNGLKRTADVYLPGNYTQDLNRRYKVLYAFDGQQLLSIAFEVYLNSLTASRQMQPIIVVAIHSLDGDLRNDELGAGPYIDVFGGGTLSDAFNKFVINELIPAVNKKYRTLTTPQDTAVMGWSLGGLAATYLGWQYANVFGIVGAFSPSLWWRTASQPGFELQARVIHQLVRSQAKRPGLRLWFEAGTNEGSADIDKNGVPDVIQDVQDLVALLQQKGYQIGTDVVFVQVEGGQHDITTWARVLPEFLHWAFPYNE